VAKADSKPSSQRRTARPQRTTQARRVGRLLVLVAAIVLIVDGLVGDRGLMAMMRARRQYDELSVALERPHRPPGAFGVSAGSKYRVSVGPKPDICTSTGSASVLAK
jgi:hypothetical protein